MHAAWIWAEAHQQWILGTAIPVLVATVITGLSDYPKASGVVKWLKLGLSLLSVVQHSDSPGSLKSLGVPSSPPVSR